MNNRPYIDELNQVAAQVDEYPVAGSQLAEVARRHRAREPVMRFFEQLPGDAQFESRTDLLARAYEALLLEEERDREPREKLQSYDE